MARAPAAVTVHYGESALELRVTDEGGESRAVNGGHGLIGMRERALMLGGEIDAGPQGDGGYRVHARLPLNPRS